MCADVPFGGGATSRPPADTPRVDGTERGAGCSVAGLGQAIRVGISDQIDVKESVYCEHTAYPRRASQNKIEPPETF